ncbi:MAG: hypothetical protein PVG41_18410 [Desulfobacteraceae bacterium]
MKRAADSIFLVCMVSWLLSLVIIVVAVFAGGAAKAGLDAVSYVAVYYFIFIFPIVCIAGVYLNRANRWRVVTSVVMLATWAIVGAIGWLSIGGSA